MTEEQQAEMIEIMEIMELLANELEAEIEARYEDILRYPSMGQRRERDMAIVKRARALIKDVRCATRLGLTERPLPALGSYIQEQHRCN